MDSNRSRAATLIGVAAAAGAFGVAALISMATAPTSRADDFTQVVNAVDFDYSTGTTLLTTAGTDFSGGDFALGLAALLPGVNDDSVVAPENLLIGIVEVLTNEPFDDETPFYDFPLPADFSDAVSTAENLASWSAGDFSLVATDLASGDYGAALTDYAYGLNLLVLDPLEQLLLGAAVSF